MRFVYLPLLAVLLITYAYVLNCVKKNSAGLTPILGWLTGLAFFLMIPLTVITLNGGYVSPRSYDINNWGDVSLSNPNYFRPYLLVWLSLMLTSAVAYFLCPAVKEPRSKDDATSRRLKHAILVTMGVSVVVWTAMIQMVGGFEAFLLSHWYSRVDDLVQQYGTLFILFDHVNEANQIAFTAAAALYMSINLRDRNTRWPFTSLILLFLLLEIVMSGNRIFFALYLLAFLVSCWVFNRKKVIIGMLVASPLLGMVFSVWAAVRHDLASIAESTTTYVSDDSTSNRVVTGLIGATEGTDVVLLMHMINDFGGRFDYQYGKTYGRLLTFFVPRGIYPHRPPDFTTLSGNLYEPGETTSLASTALGEAYANFGIFGIFVLPAVTWFACRYTDRLSRSGNTFSLASGAAFIMFIWFARGTFAESLILFLGTLLLIWILRLERTPNALARISPGLAGEPAPIR
jgi:O-antigen polysaccharide polymerase Wzy